MQKLKAYQSRPALLKRDMSSLIVKDMSTRIASYKAGIAKKSPEASAISFYLGNHLFSDLLLQVGPDKILSESQRKLAEAYYEIVVDESMRAFAYLYLITTREARHMHGSVPTSVSKPIPGGMQAAQFIENLSGSSVSAVNELLASSLSIALGDYAKLLVQIFDTMHWSSGFGGKAWGRVTKAMQDFITGTYSAEMLLDTVFTLAHNNGPIFNKGMLYNKYNTKELLKILDVQRAGQIPSLVKMGASGCPYTEPAHHNLLTLGEKALGKTYPDKVDWAQVKSLGALGHYEDKIKAQKESDPEYQAKVKKAEAAKAAKKAQLEAEQAKKKAEEVVIAPGLTVKKTKRSLKAQGDY